MFRKLETTIDSNIVCLNSVDNLDPMDFKYFDKDGFELNLAEQKYYNSMGYPVDYTILNHCCWQEPWFELINDKLILDHCMLLARCGYAGAAREQLLSLQESIPYANLLLNVKPKWGYDFALDAIAADGTVYEVLHIEVDDNIYTRFEERLSIIESIIQKTDWHEAADYVWNKRAEWQHLQGFEQNNWKSKCLLGWNKAELIEKVTNTP